MKIEEINKTDIKKVDDRELYSLRLRFLQVWKKHFEKPIEKKEELDRSSILEKYQVLKKEMDARKLNHGIKEIDKILFKKSIYNLDVPSLKEFVIVEDFISLAGDYVKNPKNVKKADIIIRSKKGQNEGLGEFASDVISEVIKKSCNVIWKIGGPDSNCIPLFDIVLRPKPITKKVEIDKPETNDDELEKVETYNCECIECGYKMKSEIHCNQLKCPECGGQMRRAERPGPGQKSTAKVTKSIRLFKIDADKQIVGVVVYAPDEVDTQGDKATAEEIEKAAHKFNLGKRSFKIMHEGKEIDVDLLETYIMPANITIGKEKVKKGSWFVVCHINDTKIWKKIKSGELGGISMGGEAERIFSLD